MQDNASKASYNGYPTVYRLVPFPMTVSVTHEVSHVGDISRCDQRLDVALH